MNKSISNNKRKVIQITLLATAALSTAVTTVSADETYSNEHQTSTIDEVASAESHSLDNNGDLQLSHEASGEDTPVKEEESAALIDSVDPSNVKGLWERAGKGKGGLLAVIDSGIELNHGMLQADKNESLAYSNEEALEAKKKDLDINRGKWVNEKVPFFNDYSQVAEAKDSKTENNYHGTHVAGIAVGNNLKQKENELHMQGTAPEAQLLFLKVDTKNSDAQREKLYATAIEDAIALGASTINISLGNTGHSTLDMQDELRKVLAKANEKGVAVVVAAGNDYAMGGKEIRPLAKHPDTGVIGTPATNDDVITIAAYVSPKAISHFMTVQNAPGTKEIPLRIASPFPSGQSYPLLFLEKGLQAAEKKDLKDKIVIINYEHVTSSKEVAELAEKLGVKGVLVHHHLYHKPLIPLSYQGSLPMGFISLEDADYLRKIAMPMVSFSNEKKVAQVPGGRQMTSFSSWGLSADGHMKPDLAAPGYEIYSPTLENGYEHMSGTSAASPHAAGIILLLQTHIKQKYPNLSPKEQLLLVKNILMSTASPIINPDTNSYYSPRLQGAGAINAKKALETEFYLTGPDGLAKIHLGDVKNQFEIKAHLHNLSDKEKNLTYYARVLKDKTEKGRFTLESQELYQTERKEVRLAPKESKEITLTVDISSYDQQLKEAMKNGYFVDGFLHVQSQEGEDKNISIPFLAFNGNFADLQALDTPIYDSLDGTFYYSPKEGQDKYDFDLNSIQEIKEQYLTGLMTEFTPWSLVEGKNHENFSQEMASEIATKDFLGSYSKEGEPTVRRFRFVDGKPYLAFSPNDDDHMDFVAFRGVFLRNVKNLKAQVFAPDQLSSSIWESPVISSVKKDVNTNDIKEKMIEATKWDGKDASGNRVKEGQYLYRVSYTPIAKGAKEQHYDFSVLVDLSPAQLPQKAVLNLSERFLELPKLSENSSENLYRDRIYYKYGEEEVNFTSFEKDEKGRFLFPTEIEDELSGEMIPINLDQLDNFYFVREDWAGNYSSLTLSQLLKESQGQEDQGNQEQEKQSQEKQTEDEKQIEESNESHSKDDPTESKKETSPTSPDSLTLSSKEDPKKSAPKTESLKKEKEVSLLTEPNKPSESKDLELPKKENLGFKANYNENNQMALPKTADSQRTITALGLTMLIGGLFQSLWSLIKKKD